MKVQVKAKDSFIHGEFNVTRGQRVMMEESLAKELSHVVEYDPFERFERKALPAAPQNKMLEPVQENKGKEAAAGEVQPSSASPVAPVLPQATSTASAPGAKKIPKAAKSS